MKKNTLVNNTDFQTETIILSNRSWYTEDELVLKVNWLKIHQNSILYRTSPLDINIELYRGWAGATGKLITAFSPEGVNWINTKDVVKACLIPKQDVRNRAGKAYDLTGPELVSMSRLKDIFEEDLNMKIELYCKSKEEVISILSQNNMPLDVLEWLAEFQEASSSKHLQPFTNTLEQIIGHPPNQAQLSKIQINYS
ncbi:hypothetical protein [Bacillus sp. 3a]|uniref:hypothetical protein n=1 Tax=Bacillus sp. 3a TaxID=580459 RepID=UPI001F4952F7|nr:hypothetical protein [Bacillus sp. 3a]